LEYLQRLVAGIVREEVTQQSVGVWGTVGDVEDVKIQYSAGGRETATTWYTVYGDRVCYC